MKKDMVIPRKRLENESEIEYTQYLREFYFEANKPQPKTRSEVASEKGLSDTEELMDGENGAYIEYLDKFYQKYYKKLDKMVAKASKTKKTRKIKLDSKKFANLKDKLIHKECEVKSTQEEQPKLTKICQVKKKKYINKQLRKYKALALACKLLIATQLINAVRYIVLGTSLVPSVIIIAAATAGVFINKRSEKKLEARLEEKFKDVQYVEVEKTDYKQQIKNFLVNLLSKKKNADNQAVTVEENTNLSETQQNEMDDEFAFDVESETISTKENSEEATANSLDNNKSDEFAFDVEPDSLKINFHPFRSMVNQHKKFKFSRLFKRDNSLNRTDEVELDSFDEPLSDFSFDVDAPKSKVYAYR